MDEKTLRLLDKVTDKLAAKIADRLVDKLGLRLADKIAERFVYHERMATLTEEQRLDHLADEALRAAGCVPGPTGWVAGEALAAEQRQRAERREQRRRDSGYYDEAKVREREKQRKRSDCVRPSAREEVGRPGNDRRGGSVRPLRGPKAPTLDRCGTGGDDAERWARLGRLPCRMATRTTREGRRGQVSITAPARELLEISARQLRDVV